MKYIYSLFLSFISTSLFGQVISQELDAEIKRRVQLEINPSFSIAVLLPDGSKSFYEYGYFDETKVKGDSLTLYEIGSITKTFTSTLANLYLKDSLNKSIATLFDGIDNPNLNEITLTDLQNHIAGVPRLSNRFSPQNWSDPFNGYSKDILNDELKELNPDSTKTWNYSNFGYGILGTAIEKASGKSYENLMRPLLKEIGMQNTFLAVPTEGYYKMAQPTNIGTSNNHWNFTGPSRYAGGLVSNANDLLNYLNYQKQNNPLFYSNAIQNPIQTAVPNLGKDKLFYKDGWFVLKPDDTTNILLHNGGTGGYISFIGFNENTNIGVVVLSNSVNIVDDIGVKILYPDFKLNHPKRTIAYEIADAIEAGDTDTLLSLYNQFKSQNYPGNIIDIYWLERFHFGKGNYSISTQLSEIMVNELPDDWEVYDIKGQNLEQLKDYKKATAFYKKALELNPENELLKDKIKRCTKLYKRDAK